MLEIIVVFVSIVGVTVGTLICSKAYENFRTWQINRFADAE